MNLGSLMIARTQGYLSKTWQFTDHPTEGIFLIPSLEAKAAKPTPAYSFDTRSQKVLNPGPQSNDIHITHWKKQENILDSWLHCINIWASKQIQRWKTFRHSLCGLGAHPKHRPIDNSRCPRSSRPLSSPGNCFRLQPLNQRNTQKRNRNSQRNTKSHPNNTSNTTKHHQKQKIPQQATCGKVPCFQNKKDKNSPKRRHWFCCLGFFVFHLQKSSSEKRGL